MLLLLLLLAQDKPPEYARLFDDAKIHKIHIALSAEDYARLGDRPFQWFKGDVEIDGEAFAGVQVREKGNSSTGIRGPKKPLKLHFPKDGCHGLHHLALNNEFKDPTLLREKLAYDLFRAAGCPASRAAFAEVTLTVPEKYDHEYLGLYTIVESVDTPFLDERFGGHDGNLYKPEGVGDIFERVDEHRLYDEKAVELKTNEKKNDRSRLVAFVRAVLDPDADLSKWIDVDSFLKWLAVNSLLSNLDSYAGSGHNYYLYDDPKTGRFIFIPWDLNEAFGNFQMGAPDDLIDQDIFAPAVGHTALIERILMNADWKARYAKLVRSLAEKDLPGLKPRIQELFKQIRDAATRDEKKMYSTDQMERGLSEDQDGRGPKQSKMFGLTSFIDRRCESVLAQLDGKRKGRMIENRPRQPKK